MGFIMFSLKSCFSVHKFGRFYYMSCFLLKKKFLKRILNFLKKES